MINRCKKMYGSLQKRRAGALTLRKNTVEKGKKGRREGTISNHYGAAANQREIDEPFYWSEGWGI